MRNFKIGAGESAQRFNGDDESAAIVWNGVESYSITAGGLRLRNVATASLPADPPDGTMVYDTTAGVVKVWNGAAWDVIGNSIAAGDGVDFSANTGTAATGAATTSELLDWYEEGTWTPTVLDSTMSTGEGQTYSFRNGAFTRTGRQVFVHGNFLLTSLGTLTGSDQVRIGGLPYQSIYQSSISVGNYTHAVGSAVSLYGNLMTSNPVILLYTGEGTSGTQALTLTQLGASGSVYFDATYIV